MVTYTSTYEYLETKQSVADKITALDSIISALYTTAARAAIGDDISEYMLDNGQTKIQTKYKSAESVTGSIIQFEKLREMLVVKYNKLKTGRVSRCVDSENLKRR